MKLIINNYLVAFALLSPNLSSAESLAIDSPVRAQLKAQQSTLLASSIAARIDYFPIKEGEAFKAKQVLAKFDCAIERSQLKKVRATLNKAQQLLSVNEQL